MQYADWERVVVLSLCCVGFLAGAVVLAVSDRMVILEHKLNAVFLSRVLILSPLWFTLLWVSVRAAVLWLWS